MWTRNKLAKKDGENQRIAPESEDYCQLIRALAILGEWWNESGEWGERTADKNEKKRLLRIGLFLEFAAPAAISEWTNKDTTMICNLQIRDAPFLSVPTTSLCNSFFIAFITLSSSFHINFRLSWAAYIVELLQQIASNPDWSEKSHRTTDCYPKMCFVGLLEICGKNREILDFARGLVLVPTARRY